MVNFYLCFVCFVGSHAFLVPDGLSTVTSPVGDIVGFVSTVHMHSNQRNVRKFLGIPYAEAPTGDLRFAKSVPKARFPTPFDATRKGPVCYQIQNVITLAPGLKFSEDCLVLNIYVPATANPVGSQYPVMIFIHGGGFVLGMSNAFDGQYLSAFNDVVVVTINYRLAVFGFLSTGDSTSPGNFGLWDQHLAIKWVHDNIKAFGGDPTRVTIFGESAGSACVVYQMLFPGNKGLFQRAIAESGSVTSSWASRKVSEAQSFTRNFSDLIGCHQHSTRELIKCLRSKTVMEINETMNTAAVLITAWKPVKDNIFLLDEPSNLFNGLSHSNDAMDMFKSIDLVIGVNSKEGIVDIPRWTALLNITDFRGVPRDGFEDVLIPFYLNFYYQKDIPDVVKHAAIFEYTDWTDPNNDRKRTDKMIDIVTDAWFSVTTVQTANVHATSRNSSTYVYKFSTQPSKHVIDMPSYVDGPGVANHADELLFVFGAGLGYGDPNPLENVNTTRMVEVDKVQRAVMKMWTNFAKTGDPNKPEDVGIYTNTAWPQYGIAENYLEITPDMTSGSAKQHLAPRVFQFWHHLVPQLLKSSSMPIAIDPDSILIG